MGIEASLAEQDIVRKMISRKTRYWCLMKLPKGQWQRQQTHLCHK